jgi:hypothetical protein
LRQQGVFFFYIFIKYYKKVLHYIKRCGIVITVDKGGREYDKRPSNDTHFDERK